MENLNLAKSELERTVTRLVATLPHSCSQNISLRFIFSYYEAFVSSIICVQSFSSTDLIVVCVCVLCVCVHVCVCVCVCE